VNAVRTKEAETKARKVEILTQEDEAVLFGSTSEAFDYPLKQMDRSGGGQGDNSIQLNTLDHATDPLINKLRTVRDTLTNCPELWAQLANLCPERQALIDDHLCDNKINLSFSQMDQIVQKSATVFADLGIQKGKNVAVFGENSARWLMVDHGIQMAGGGSAVRGADAPIDELLYIYENSDSAGVAVLQGPRLLEKLIQHARTNRLENLGLQNEYGPVRTILLMHREKKTDQDIAKLAAEAGVTVKVFGDLLEAAAPIEPSRKPNLSANDIATIGKYEKEQNWYMLCTGFRSSEACFLTLGLSQSTLLVQRVDPKV
jgi:AMP-binding enzyme